MTVCALIEGFPLTFRQGAARMQITHARMGEKFPREKTRRSDDFDDAGFSHGSEAIMSKAVNVTRRWSGVRQKCVLFVLACFVMPICTGQKIDCSSGFLCDFFSKFPHLPFTRLHPNNAGYIRTLDYLIHKESNFVLS